MTGRQNSRQFKLRDGRQLGYAEFGAPGGKPIFYFHGFPSSRLDWRVCVPDETAKSLNIRIIAIDRPGLGLSDFKSGRKLLDWPDDVVELADELELDRFSVLGMSGGGPYASACAFKIPERLNTVGIVSGMGPANAPGARQGASWVIPRKNRLVRRLFLYLMAFGVRKQPDKVISSSLDLLPEPDRMLLNEPGTAKIYIESILESFRAGTGGVNHEAGLYTRPWEFELGDITAEVHLWHGELDQNVPVSVGRFYAENIPNCNANFFDDEGHLSILRNRADSILRTLAG